MSKINETAIITEALVGQRLDQALSQLFPQYSRSRLTAWLREGKILINGHCRLPKEKALGGEEILLQTELAPVVRWQAQAMPLTIVYEDEDLLVLNKPAGLVVHPAAGNPDSTLVNALLHYHPPLDKLPRAGIVHRLDKETTGLLMVAKRLEAHHYFVAALQRRKIKRQYMAIVQGEMVAGSTVDAPIGRHPKTRTKMAVVSGGKAAVTHYRVLKKFHDFTLVQCTLETGRTHQIRVHLAHVYYPLVGDPLYNPRLKLPKGCSDELIEKLRGFRRQALHAQQLELLLPNGEPLKLEIPLPKDMQELLDALEQHRA